MSENQYEPKFVTTAKTKPEHQALRAAERLAENRAAGRSCAPSSSAVFKPFDMSLYFTLDPSDARIGRPVGFHERL